jgi:nicotinamidase-related amidase
MANGSGQKYGVVLVHMQDYFFRGHPVGERKASLIASQKEALGYCRVNRIPVAVVEFDGNEFGHTLADLQDEVKSLPMLGIFRGKDTDCFDGTRLYYFFEDYGVDSPFLMGVHANWCIIDTAKGAKRHGYNVGSARDVIGDCPKYEEKAARWFRTNGSFADSFRDVPPFSVGSANPNHK